MSNPPGNAFVRPGWTADTFRDPLGTVIEYGDRWSGEPPVAAYSTTSNLERFAPLHQVAAALIDHLARSCAVRIVESGVDDLALVPEPPEFDRVVRLVPESGRRLPLTIVFTSFPGVAIYTGAEYVEAFPACGCDACDDSIDDVVDQLERCVLDLAGGRLRWESRG